MYHNHTVMHLLVLLAAVLAVAAAAATTTTVEVAAAVGRRQLGNPAVVLQAEMHSNLTLSPHAVTECKGQ